MVARTISARRNGATPRLGLTCCTVLYLIGRPIILERDHRVNPSASSRELAAARAGELDERHRVAAERVLRQLAVPAGEVLLLDQDGRQRCGDPGVVRGLGLALDAERVGDAARLGERRVALALGRGGDDLGLALGLDKLVAFLLGLLLFDLLGCDRLLVGRVEADVGEGRFLQLDPVLVQIGREGLLEYPSPMDR